MHESTSQRRTPTRDGLPPAPVPGRPRTTMERPRATRLAVARSREAAARRKRRHKRRSVDDQEALPVAPRLCSSATPSRIRATRSTVSMREHRTRTGSRSAFRPSFRAATADRAACDVLRSPPLVLALPLPLPSADTSAALTSTPNPSELTWSSGSLLEIMSAQSSSSGAGGWGRTAGGESISHPSKRPGIQDAAAA